MVNWNGLPLGNPFFLDLAKNCRDWFSSNQWTKNTGFALRIFDFFKSLLRQNLDYLILYSFCLRARSRHLVIQCSVPQQSFGEVSAVFVRFWRAGAHFKNCKSRLKGILLSVTIVTFVAQQLCWAACSWSYCFPIAGDRMAAITDSFDI